jgi:hypothetical protein
LDGRSVAPELGLIGMRVLLLCQLRPGDIILETGVPRIAAAGGGLFGHASVALGQLIKIEAGKDSGVELNPFDFVVYRKGERRMLGVAIEPAENVCVLRRREALDEGTIRGEALWEAGRAYSVPKLLELSDLPQATRMRLDRILKSMPEAEPVSVREGRFCSEVAARILRLSNTTVSPNALANAPELKPVKAAIVDLDENWTEEGSDASLITLCARLNQLRVGLAQRGLSELEAAADRIRTNRSSLAREVDEVGSLMDGEIRSAISVLDAIEELAPSIVASS